MISGKALWTRCLHRGNAGISRRLRNSLYFVLFVVLAIGVVRVVRAAFPVDMDRNNTNESTVDITAGSLTSPPSIRNIVTNKTSGGTYSFDWRTAGPGGFAGGAGTGSLSPGATSVWEWQTTSTVFSIGCFRNNPLASNACILFSPDNNPYPAELLSAVPGRSLSSSGVTSTTQSITTTYLQAFSPLRRIFQLVSEVKQQTNGQFRYQTTIQNLSGFSIDFTLAAAPLCCDVDLSSDPQNCGTCGLRCPAGALCQNGQCSVCDPPQVGCANGCVDLSSDPNNCGACGTVCPACNSCSGGQCFFDTGICPAVSTSASESASLIIPEQSGQCAFPTQSPVILIALPQLSTGTVPTSVDGVGIHLGPGDPPMVVDCSVSDFPAKEVTSQLAANCAGVAGEAPCTLGGSGVHGPANVFVPDPSVTIGDAFLSALKVEVRDASGNGQLEPGEAANLFVYLVNAGSKGLAGLGSSLAADVIDLDGQSVDPGSDPDPDPISVTQALSPYPDIPGAAITGGGPASCATPAAPLTPAPARNVLAFSIVVPPDHPSSTTHPFTLSLTGHLSGATAPFDITPVHFELGIGSHCDAQNVRGDFDTLKGFLAPMALLVPEGDTPPLPPRSFAPGSVIPLKLQLACGATPLTPDNAVPPRIMALTSSAGPIDLTTIDPDAGNANQNGLPFRYDTVKGQWVYNLSGKTLASGRYLITVLMPNGRSFTAAFVMS
jgi:hypothetical protein